MITNRPVRFSANTNIRELRVSFCWEWEHSERKADVKNEENREKAATEKDEKKSSFRKVYRLIHFIWRMTYRLFHFFFKQKPQLVTTGQWNDEGVLRQWISNYIRLFVGGYMCVFQDCRNEFEAGTVPSCTKEHSRSCASFITTLYKSTQELRTKFSIVNRNIRWTWATIVTFRPHHPRWMKTP